MRKIGILGLVGVLALFLAGCGGGGGDDRVIINGPGLVGIDDTSDTTAPLLRVTYTVPPSPNRVTVEILSDLASDGHIAFDPVFSSFTVTAGPPTVLFGIDSFDIDLPEFRAFLTFPLNGDTGQPVVPGDALIVSAEIEVFVNFLDFASAVPTFLDLVEYPFRGLGSGNPAIDFDAVVLAALPVFDFLASDAGGPPVLIEVTSLMQAAQVPPALVDFQVRFSHASVPPLAPARPSVGAGRTVGATPRSMEGIVPRQPATAKPLSPAELAVRRR
jgi:hypothetical protein